MCTSFNTIYEKSQTELKVEEKNLILTSYNSKSNKRL